MYCTNCGTMNQPGSFVCGKCGHGFEAAGETKEQSAIDITLAARHQADGPVGPILAGGSGLKMVIIGLAVVMLLLVPIVLLGRMAQTAPMNASSGAAGESDNQIPGHGAGLGLAPGVKSTVVANDAARKAVARRLQLAIEAFYAEHNRYPQALSDLPPAAMGSAVDEQVYQYRQLADTNGYRLEVTMETNNVSGANVITEGDVTKYVIGSE